MLEGGGKKSASLSLAVNRTFVSLDAFPDESVLKSIDVRQRRLRLFEVRMDFLYFSTVSALCISITPRPLTTGTVSVAGCTY